MTGYTTEDLASGTEFKILRSVTSAFKRPDFLKQVLDEEKQAGPDGIKRHVRADAAIVTGPDLTYVLAIYARGIEDTRWTVDNDALVTGARISRMVFDHFRRAR